MKNHSDSEKYNILEQAEVANILPPRPKRSNKGTFGRVLVVAGCDLMCGAAFFAAKAAYRSGAGLVEILSSASNRDPLSVLLPEALIGCYESEGNIVPALERADSIVIGCGLGKSETSKKLIRLTLGYENKPIVIDADALNIISEDPDLLDTIRDRKNHNIVVTPHPGEMSRLTKIPVGDILQNIPKTASDFSVRYNTVTVLKDAETVIASPDGSITVNTRGNSGMATGGSGDVLAGIIGALLAGNRQRTDVTYAQSAAAGVFLHATAGDIAAKKHGEISMIASDIIENLGDAVCDILHSIL